MQARAIAPRRLLRGLDPAVIVGSPTGQLRKFVCPISRPRQGGNLGARGVARGMIAKSRYAWRRCLVSYPR